MGRMTKRPGSWNNPYTRTYLKRKLWPFPQVWGHAGRYSDSRKLQYSPKELREILKKDLINAGAAGIKKSYIDPEVLKPLLKKGLAKHMSVPIMRYYNHRNVAYTVIVWSNPADFEAKPEPEERVPYKKRNEDLKAAGMRYRKGSV